MASLNNPAGRLLRLLDEGDKQREGNESVYTVIAKVCGVDETNQAEVLHIIGLVLQMPYEIVQHIRSMNLTEDEANLLLRWVKPVNRIVSHAKMNERWTTFSGKFEKHITPDIEYCDVRLASRYPSLEAKLADIAEMRDELDSLLEDAEGADETQEREFILNAGKKIRNAIDRIKITGVAPPTLLARAARAGIDSHPERDRRLAESPPLTRFWKWLGRFVNLGTIAEWALVTSTLVMPLLIPETTSTPPEGTDKVEQVESRPSDDSDKSPETDVSDTAKEIKLEDNPDDSTEET